MALPKFYFQVLFLWSADFVLRRASLQIAGRLGGTERPIQQNVSPSHFRMLVWLTQPLAFDAASSLPP
jgi:hypothetical protein